MSFLLDTHVLWWAFAEPERLRPAVAALLTSIGPGLHYSPLSLFELAVKRAKGRLSFDDETILGGLAEMRFRELPVRPRHALRAGALPNHHRDPFDRLLLAQALEEGMTLISRDKQIRLYDAPVMEA